MKFFKYKKQKLFCEDVEVLDICKKYETPFYLYSNNALVYNYNSLDKLLKNFNAVIAYSVKANSNLSVLRTFASCGAPPR